MRKLGVVVMVIVVLGVIAIPAIVSGAQGGQAGDSNLAQVTMRGPWGKLHYNLSGCTVDVVFNGHALEPEIEYVLQYGPWWGPPGEAPPPAPRPQATEWLELGRATAGQDGNIHLAGSADPWELWATPHTSWGNTWKNRQFRLVYWRESPAGWVVVLRATLNDFTYDCPD